MECKSVRSHADVNTRMLSCIYVYNHVHIYMCLMHVCSPVCMCIIMYIYTYLIHVCSPVCMCIITYIYTYNHAPGYGR